MQRLDDASMSDVSGKDGISIRINTPDGINARIIWTDHDGLLPTGHGISVPTAGSVVFGDGVANKNFKISGGITNIVIDTDGGTGSPFVNIAIELPDDLTIETGNIYVAGRDNAGGLLNQTKIFDNMVIDLGGLDLNLQLGNEPQGGFISVTGVIKSGIRISNVNMISSTSVVQGDVGIGMDEVVITDANMGQDLTFNGMKIGLVPSGLKITPSVDKKVDITMSNVRFGGISTASSIGDVAVVGLKLGGTALTIAGH